MREQAADGHVLRIRIALVSSIEDDLTNQVQRVSAFDLSFDDLHQNMVIDGWEELGHIGFQAIHPVPLLLGLPEELDDAVHGVMASLHFPAGIGIIDKEVVPDWLDDVHYGVVNNPIPEGRNVNQALFRFIEVERPVAAWLVCPGDKVFLDGDKIFFQIIAKRQDLVSIATAQGRLAISLADILEGNDFMIEVSVSFHWLSNANAGGVRASY